MFAFLYIPVLFTPSATALKEMFTSELTDLNMAILKQFDDNGVPYKKYDWD